MDNMAIGTICKIYKTGSKKFFANAVIKKVENFRSIGVADKILKKEDLYELKQDEENYGNLMAVLKLKADEPTVGANAFEKQVKHFIKPYKFLTIADKADFQLELKKVAEGKLASLVDRNNKEIWKTNLLNDDSLSSDDILQLVRSIKNTLRIKKQYLRTMPMAETWQSLLLQKLFR